jgi:hypothetical protein
MERATEWWSSEWARWLGWTLAFALVAGTCGRAYRTLRPGIAPGWSLALLVPPLAAAFLIGARFPSRWWWAGPPLATFLAGTPLLLVPYEVALPYMQWPILRDVTLTYGEAMLLAGVVMLLGGAILLAALAVAAYKGVRWGRRRAVAAPAGAGPAIDEPNGAASA